MEVQTRNRQRTASKKISDLMQKVVLPTPETLGSLGTKMLPISGDMKETFSVVACNVSDVAYEMLIDIFGIAASDVLSLVVKAAVLKTIEKKLDKLSKKIDKMLKSDLETAKNRLVQALNYLEEEENFYLAFQEFKHVLSSAENAYPKVKEFKDKILCKQLIIYSRLMTSIYDKDRRTFIPRSQLSEAKLRNIARSVFIDIKHATQDFCSAEIPLSKFLLGNSEKQKQKNQDVLNSLLKPCIPIIWKYQQVFIGSSEDEIIQYVPEGVDDAAEIVLHDGIRIMVWKERICSDKFKMQWLTDFKFLKHWNEKEISNSYPIINDETCSSSVFASIKYTLGEMTFDNFKACFDNLRNTNGFEVNNTSILVTFDTAEDAKYLRLFPEHYNFELKGHWYDDFIQEINSTKDLVDKLKNIPDNVRLYCRDRDGYVILHWLQCNQKFWHNDDVMKLCINRQNSELTEDGKMCTPLDRHVEQMVSKLSS